jgi:malonyl-CoA O-methyltransferase
MSAHATRVPAGKGYALWAATCDATPSPIAALSDRLLLPWLDRCHPRRPADIGCGTGRWTARLGAIGIDASPPMLAVAASKPGLHGRLVVADAAALPIASRSADLVLCTLMLGYAPDPVSVLRELARILEPGGTLILTDFHPAAAAQGWRRTFRHDGQVYELETHPYTLEQLRDAAPGLALRECLEAVFGEPERAVFQQAGKPELFEAVRHIPAVLLTLWSRA